MVDIKSFRRRLAYNCRICFLRRRLLRALRASGDFDAYRDFHEMREYERNHARRYADGIAPPLGEPPSSPRPRRVK